MQVYYAQLVAVLKDEEDGDGDNTMEETRPTTAPSMVKSQSRTLWPAAHRTRLDAFSDGVVLSW